MNSLITNNQLLSNYANNNLIISKTQAEILQKIKYLEQKFNNISISKDINSQQDNEFKILEQKFINLFNNVQENNQTNFQQLKLLQDELKNVQSQILLLKNTQDQFVKNTQEQFRIIQEQLKQYIQNYIHTTISNIINPINPSSNDNTLENNMIERDNNTLLNIQEPNINVNITPEQNNIDDIIIEEKKEKKTQVKRTTKKTKS